VKKRKVQGVVAQEGGRCVAEDMAQGRRGGVHGQMGVEASGCVCVVGMVGGGQA